MQSLIAQARESVLVQFKDEAEKARELGRQRGLQEGRLAGGELDARLEIQIERLRTILVTTRRDASNAMAVPPGGKE